MLYANTEVLRMMQIYGNLRGDQTYLINELRRGNAVDVEHLKLVAFSANTWLGVVKDEFPKEIRDELEPFSNLERLLLEIQLKFGSI